MNRNPMRKIIDTALLLCLLIPLARADVQYVYDGAGRLVQAIGDSNQIYQYDPAGNISGLLNNPSSVQLVTFSPASGSIGTTVTLSGANFATVPAQNTVTFNGTSVTVSAATTTTLTVTVPTGATSGPISVTTSGVTATSATNFVVSPAIQGFNPSFGIVGSSVTITGTGFDPATGGDIVQFNGCSAAVTSASSTTIVATVPVSTSTGPISVTTGTGSAISSSDFFIATTDGVLTSSNAPSVTEMTEGGSGNSISSLPTSNYTLLLIKGDASNLYSLQFSSLTSGANLAYSLYAPDNTTAPVIISSTSSSQWPPISGTNLSLHLPLLSKQGYYTLAISTDTNSSNFNVILEKDSVISTDGTALNGSITTAGQSERYVFAGYVNEYLGFGIKNIVMPGTSLAGFRIYDPAGSDMISGGVSYGACYSDGTVNLIGCSYVLPDPPYPPTAGTYSGLQSSGLYGVVVFPWSGSTCSSSTPCTFSAYLTQDLTGTLTQNTWATLATTVPGQNLRYSFAGTAGQTVSLDVANLVTSPSGQAIQVTVYDPNNWQFDIPFNIGPATGTSQYGNSFTLPPLPSTGTYTVLVDKFSNDKDAPTISSVDVLLDTGASFLEPYHEYFGEPQGTSLVDANPPPKTFNNTAPLGFPAPGSITTTGNNFLYNFVGTAGYNAGLALSMSTMPGAPSTVGIVVYDPTNPGGTPLVSTNCVISTAVNCAVNLASLPMTGLYTVAITPDSGTTCGTSPNCNFYLGLGSPSTTTSPPEMQVISFGAQSTQAYSSGGTFVLSPPAVASSGLTVTYASTTTSVCTISGTTVTMLSTGTCTITADQAGNSSYAAAPEMTQNITFTSASQTITFGSQSTQAFSLNGTFSLSPIATASSGLSVAYSSTTTGVCTISGTTVTMIAAGTCTIAANQAGNSTYPAAAQVTQNITIGQNSQTITFGSQAAQTYNPGATFSLNPQATASSGLAVTYASTTTGVCTLSGTIVAIVSAGTCMITADQSGNSNYTAATQVAQNITIQKASQAITYGAQPAQVYSSGGTFSLSPAPVASSGLSVSYASTTTSVCTISGTTPTVTIVSGGTCTVTENQTGNANYNAAAQVTQNITINKIPQTLAFGSQWPVAYVSSGTFSLSPAATASSGLSVAYSSTTTGVCTISGTTVTMVAAGTCTIAADQSGNSNYTAATGLTQNITINNGSVVTNIPLDGTVESGSITASGNNLLYSFSATAGDNLGMGMSVQTLTGTAHYVNFEIDNPDGSQLYTGTCNFNGTNPGNGCAADLANLPQTGDYNIIISTLSGTTCGTSPHCSFNLSMSSPVTGTLTVNPTGLTTFSTSTMGQDARYTFTTLSGSYSYTLKLSGRTFTGTTNITIYGPSPATTQVSATGMAITTKDISLGSLSASSTYTVVIDTNNNSTGQIKLKVTQP
jgi:hypothetical protein